MSARLFRPVHNGHRLDGSRNGVYESVAGERSVKSDFDKTDFLSFSVEIIHGFFNRFRTGAHDNDDSVCVFGAVVIDEVIFSAGEGGNFIHLLLNDCGDGVVIFI